MSLKQRMARAESYVLGQMDEHDRERAERDMEVDTEFCECVFLLAERFRRFDQGSGDETADAIWHSVASRIGEMPQMSAVAPPRTGRVPATATAIGRGLHETGGRRGLAVAIALVIAFGLGYLAGAIGATPS